MNTPTRKRRPAGQRAFPIRSTVEGAFEDGKSEVESLKEEIGEWKENLEGNSMEHLPKYDEVSECSDALDAAMDIFDGIDFPSCISDTKVTYTMDTRQSAGSRSGRLSNAQNALDAAKSQAESWLDENPELEFVEEDENSEGMDLGDNQTHDQAEVDQRETNRSEVETFIEQMEEAIGELENVNFPGMY